MGNYIKRPEPGRQVEKIQVVEKTIEKTTEKQSNINLEDLANAVAKAIGSQIQIRAIGDPSLGQNRGGDRFDDSKTMEQLAACMIVQRGKNESNFDDLGDVKKTKREVADIDKTIDLLSDLNDQEKR